MVMCFYQCFKCGNCFSFVLVVVWVCNRNSGGFKVFKNYRLFEAGETVENANVWLGNAGTVPLVIEDELTITIPKSARRNMKVKVIYDSPIPAPIDAGMEVARLEVTAPDIDPIIRPLKTAQSVSQLAFFGRITSAIKFIIFGASSGS